jgi:nitroreductase
MDRETGSMEPHLRAPERMDAFPRNGTTAEQLAYAVRYAILAPSSHNSQPWLFVVYDDHLALVADRSRALRIVDPSQRELAISCGAALYHLRLALRHFGVAARVEWAPATMPDLLASVWLSGRYTPSDDDERLFAAMPRRHTNRSPFAREEIDEPTRLQLVAAARAEDAWLDIATGVAKESLATLIAEADRRQLGGRPFREELASWLRPYAIDAGDGMPGDARARSDLLASIEPLIVRTFDIGKGVAARDHELAVGSPLLAVLGTDGDDERDWLRAGQALARVLLQATAMGLAASFLNQPIELGDSRSRVCAILEKCGYPQLVLRLGRPTAPAAATPRRPLEDVIRRGA